MHLTAFFLLIFKFEKKPKKAAGQEQQVGFVLHLKKKKQNKTNPTKIQPKPNLWQEGWCLWLRHSSESQESSFPCSAVTSLPSSQVRCRGTDS